MARVERYVPIEYMPRAAPVLATVPPPESAPELPRGVRDVVRDVAYLVPAFRERYMLVLAELVSLGFEPITWETLRTAERAEWLLERGSSRNGARSMHLYGVAADTICGVHHWSCTGKLDHGFWAALGRASRRQGLCWGGDWRTLVDLPHVQAVTVRMQNAVRASDDVAGLVARHLDGRAA